MKRVQFSYYDEIQLITDLGNLRLKIDNMYCSEILFSVYSELLDKQSISFVCGHIERAFPNAKICGCTTAANVDSGELTEGSIFVTCTIFEDIDSKVNVVQIEKEGRSVNEVIDLIDKFREENEWVSAVEFLTTMSVMSSTAFYDSLKYLSGYAFIFGGGAINRQIDVNDTWVFSKGNPISDKGIVAIMYGGNDFHVYSKTIVGWRPLGKDFKITKANGNILYELDGAPAFQAYSRYLKIDNNDIFLANSMEFPMLLKNSEGAEALRTGMISRDDGSVEFASMVDNFVSARLTFGSQDNIVMDADEAAMKMSEFEPQVLNAYSCFGRKNFLGDSCTIDIRPFSYLGTLSGFFTSGELATDDNGIFLHHNETLVVVGMREGDAYGAVMDFPHAQKNTKVSLGSRLVNFIGVATQELQAANQQLEKLINEVEEKRIEADSANKAKSDFLANMSHEIRTPINAILGFDTMILRETVDENIMKYAFDIHNAGENLLSIINDILDLSKVESGRMEIIESEYELSSIISDAMNMVLFKGRDKGIDIVLCVNPEIPDWFIGDDVRIRQIIVNLLNNAIKYTEKGTVTLRVDGKREGEFETLHVEVEDTGIGIREEDMGNLFEKFKRIEENRNKNIEGSGLGMSITIMLLSLMGSHIEVQSEYGFGSKFSFDLKQKVSKDEMIGNIDDRINDKPMILNYETQFTAPDAKILLVDDNSLNRKVIMGLLKHICQNIDEADGGLSAIDITEIKKYDLILLDHMMPDLDGISAFHRIRNSEVNLNRETPVIMLTANAITGAKESYMSEGFEAFLSKPVDPEKMEKVLLEYLPKEKIVQGNSMTQNKKKNETRIPQIDGIESSYALMKLTSEELVIDTMKSFAKSARMESEILNDMKNKLEVATDDEEKCLYDYEVKVHSMKSNLAMIGALQLSGVAKALEYGAKEGNLLLILSLTDSFLKDYNEIAGKIIEALPSEEIGQKEFDKNAFLQSLSNLNSVLGFMDIDTADDLIASLKEYAFPEVIASHMEKLEAAVINIDLDNTKKISDEIKSLL